LSSYNLVRELLVICGTLCLLAWLYLLLLHGRFWQVGPCLPPKQAALDIAGPVAVIIPARNEAENISRAICSLLNQTCANAVHIFVVDDNSSDGTAEVARAAAGDQAAKLTVISGRALPSGWTGKLWAVQQGVEAAVAHDPRFLLLTDADIEHAPDNLATLVSIAEHDGYDLVSLMVKLHCHSVAEKLLIPVFVFFFFMLYPPLWIRSAKKQIAGAAGGCILIRPEALERAGGLNAIRSEIIDDCALARHVKRTGGRVWLGLSPNTRSFRAYDGFEDIDRMIARTAFNQLGHSAELLVGAIIGMALLYLLPFALLFTGRPLLIGSGLAAWAIMTFTYLPMVRFYGLRYGWALTLPGAAIFYMAATIDSALKFWSGRGGEWKGRSQDLSSSK
jgi:hopene-associated glycosyltransferase HpnB